MSSPAFPLADPVVPALQNDPAISDEQRADLFDVFHGSKDPDELVRHLQPLAIPDDLKQNLFDLKKKLTPVVPPIDKATAAIKALASLDPSELEAAESHPNVLRVLAAAATAPEKTPETASGASSAASKGKQAPEGKQAAPLALPARPDGSQHLPPIPTGHRRVLASDGGIHDIPEENVARAFEIDPRLHVLNP